MEEPFAPGEPARDVALVLLEAAALPRRLAGASAWPALRPHEWQVLLALALASPKVDRDGALTPVGLASALALDVEDVLDALDSLREARLAAIGWWDDQRPEPEQEWSLTSSGSAAAVRIAALAGRVLRWPPPPPATLS